MSDDDWTQDPEAREWIEHVRENVVPAMDDSAFVAPLVTSSEPDVKFAVEIGLAILLDKPIVACVVDGADVPPKLAQIADRLIHVDFSTEESRQLAVTRLTEAMDEMAGA